MFAVNLECYLWDLLDDGVEQVLDRLKGQVGVTGISVPALCPPLEQLRPHPGSGPHVFRTEGGAMWQADPTFYAGTRLRPSPAGWLRKRDPLNQVAAGCRERGLSLRVAIDACNSPAIVERHPLSAVKDAFGEPVAWMCPNNPDVREFLSAVLAEWSARGAASIELGNAHFPCLRPGHPEAHEGLDLGPQGRWLYSLCFCESCRHLATRDGFEFDALHGLARSRLEHALNEGEPLGSPADLFEEPLVAGFLTWRARQIVALHAALRKACSCELVLHQAGTPECDGTDWSALAGLTDRMMVRCVEPSIHLIEDAISYGLRVAHDPGRIELGLSVGAYACPDSQVLVAGLRHAAARGVAGASLANYGLLPLGRLEWIRNAIRYAQRETGDR